MRRRQSGNILFLILMGVVLFGMVTFVVTQSSRDSNTVPRERARIMASQITTFATQVEQTAMRARTAMRIPEWSIDFSDETGPSKSDPNATCTTEDCRIFTAMGGVIGSVQFDNRFVDGDYRKDNPTYGDGNGTELRFSMIEVKNVGGDLPDLVMRIPGLNEVVCEQLNVSLWGQDSTAVDDLAGSDVPYSGTMTEIPPSTQIIGDENTFFVGKQSGCIRHTGEHGGEFYHVLIQR